MGRPVAFAAFVLIALPLCFAQMRGGVRAGPGAMRGGVAPQRGFRGFMGVPGRAGFVGMTPGRVRFGTNFHFFHNCPGCFPHRHLHFASFFPWWYYPYGGYYGAYYPVMWNSPSYQDQDYSYQRDVARQIDELSQEVQRLREQIDARQYTPPPTKGPPPDPQPEAAKSTSDLPTVLVFRDQRVQEIQNYAIVGETMVVIADQRQRKIPLRDIDVAATTKLNDERGVDFQVPR